MVSLPIIPIESFNLINLLLIKFWNRFRFYMFIIISVLLGLGGLQFHSFQVETLTLEPF
jgi:hypothetical protein